MPSTPFEIGTMYWHNPRHQPPDLEKDLQAIRDNHFSFVRMFIWWEQVERREGHFDFAMHDAFFTAADRVGLKVMTTFGFYLPFWLNKTLAGKGIEDKGRYACLDRPEVAEPLGRFVDEVVRRYSHAPALAIWNLWNEPTKSPCACEHTRAKFVAWLKERYRTIDALQEAWMGEFQVFDTIRPDRMDDLTVEWIDDVFRHGKRGRASPMQVDWLKFSSLNLAENLQWLRDRVRAIDPAHETHANPACPVANGVCNGINEWEMGRVLDSISVSIHSSFFFYPLETESDFPCALSYAADQVRGWANGKDAWIGELQAGTVFFTTRTYTPSAEDISHALWQALGRGLRGVLFWQWQGWRSSLMQVGEWSLRRACDGGPTVRSDAAAAVGRILRDHAAVFHQAQRPPSRAAILVSMASKRFKTLQKLALLTSPEGIQNNHGYAVYGCYKALNRANIAVDFVSECLVAEDVLNRYQVLFLPHVEVMSAETAEAIRRFVREGGWVWADGRCAFLDEHIYLRSEIPGHGLTEMFGCREDDFVAIRADEPPGSVATEGHRPYRLRQYLTPTTGTVLGRHAGRPTAVRNAYGRGVAELHGSYVTLGLQQQADAETRNVLVQFASDAGVAPKLKIEPSLGFEACLLTGPEADVLIVTHHTGQATEAVIATPAPYADVTCLQGSASLLAWDSTRIRCRFSDAQTLVLVARHEKASAPARGLRAPDPVPRDGTGKGS